METIEQLKARVYDLMVLREQAMNEIQSVNQRIAVLHQGENNGATPEARDEA